MRYSTPIIISGLISLMICGLVIGEWRGFRGIEKDGRHLKADGPLKWSSSNNVLWKTKIPGRGHSSPIISGKKVYVTTTYEVSMFSYGIWNYAIASLTLLLAVAGMSVTMQALNDTQKRVVKLFRYIRLFLFVQIIVAVLIVALFGRHLLDFESDEVRPLLASVVLMLCCLIIGSLSVPLKSRQQLIAGLVSLMFAAPVFVVFQRKGLSFDFDSMKGIAIVLALVSPVVFGFVLISAHFLSRKHQPTTVRDNINTGRSSVSWILAATVIGGFLAGLMPFVLLIYRAAGYHMPDTYIWDNRVKPNTEWWFVALFAIVMFLAVAADFLRLIRGGRGDRFLPVQKIFFVLSMALGITSFVQAGFVEKPDEFARVLMCLDADHGRILWRCEGLKGKTKGRSRAVTCASPTPVTDGQRIYAYFGEDGLMCVNTEGKLLWKKTDPMFKGSHGVGTSPVVKDNILIIVSDVGESKEMSSSISAFDCITAKRLWERSRKSHKEFAAYGTPMVGSLNGEQIVIVHGWHDIKAYHIKTGRELWSYPIVHKGNHLVASLTCDDERLYVTGMKQIIALDISRLASGDDPVVWSTSIVGEKSSTPVVISGLIFLVTERGTASCLDSKTGKIFWEKRIPGRYYSSVMATANRILFTSESGRTTVIAVDREFRELAANDLGESVYSTPAHAGNRLYLRTTRYLYCFQKLIQPVSLLTHKTLINKMHVSG